MTDFTFTQRDATFVKRFIQLYAEDFVKDIELKKQMDSDTFKTEMDEDTHDYTFKATRGPNDKLYSIIVSMEIGFRYSDINIIDMKSLKPVIKVTIFQKNNYNTELCERPFIMESNEWVDTLIKTYQFCSCSPIVLAVKDGYCSCCYPLVIEQEDVCCICHCNEGVWIKLLCGHTMHKGCFEKIDFYKNAEQDRKWVKKCPLCRKESVCNTEVII